MGSKLSAADQQKLDVLGEAKRKWDRIHTLVEQSATEVKARDTLLQQCRRNASAMGRFFTNNALGQLAEIANDLAFIMKRPGRFESKLGSMREAVGKGYAGIDRVLSALRRKA